MKLRTLSVVVLIAYFTLLIKIMVLKDIDMIRIGHLMFNFGGTQEGIPNWIPFKTIIPYLMGEKGILIAAINILGNILLLVPVGFFMPLAYLKSNWKLAFLFGIALAFSIESSQVLFKVGIFDIDDVLLNALGLVMGYWIYSSLPSRNSKPLVWTGIIGFVLLIVYIGTPIQKHLPMLPIGFGKAEPHPLHKNSMHPVELGETPKDPCRGTGGIGVITQIKSNTLLLQLKKDGKIIRVHFSPKVEFKSAKGIIQFKDLQIGNALTLIGGPDGPNSFLADFVLVCE